MVLPISVSSSMAVGACAMSFDIDDLWSVIQGAGGLVLILFLLWSLQRASGIVPRLFEHARVILVDPAFGGYLVLQMEILLQALVRCLLTLMVPSSRQVGCPSCVRRFDREQLVRAPPLWAVERIDDEVCRSFVGRL